MKVIVLLLAIALFAGSIFWCVNIHTSAPFMYIGDLTFDTEEEYIKFKQFVTQDTVHIRDISVLSSEPPIWVRYFIIPTDLEKPPFAYEERHRYPSTGNLLATAFTVALGLIGMIAAIAWVVRDKSTNVR